MENSRRNNFEIMNLVLDIGNTRVKTAVFKDGKIVLRRDYDTLDWHQAEVLNEEFGPFDGIALSTTRKHDKDLERLLNDWTDRFIIVDRNTPVPLKGLEDTPETLGADRLSAAVGALTLFEGKDVLIVDFGTAVTVDRVTAAGKYIYGTISPGARLRFEALHDMTANLPLCTLRNAGMYDKNTTEWSIYEGVVNGMAYEIEGYMNALRKECEDFVTIFSGGDAKFFENKIKNTIFAKLDLTFIGLNRIIEYNAVEKHSF